MHYYKRNLGDYAKKAGRLSILQHGVYNLLIDACYDREEFPTTEEAIDWVWASTQEEEDAVRFVLKKFFTQGEDGKWVQGRIAEELEEYRKFCEEQARKGKAGGRPKKPAGLSEKPNGKPDESQRGQKKTLTTNHKPLTTNHNYTPEDRGLAEFIFERIREVAPKANAPNLDNWSNDIRLMRERDGHSLEEIREVFLFANRDGFWKTNILSTSKLREKFSTLHSKMITGGPNANSGRSYQSKSDRADEAARAALSQL